MTFRTQTLSSTLGLLGICGGLFGCWVYFVKPDPIGSDAKAAVPHNVKTTEEDLGLVKLTEDNYRKLGIVTAPIEKKQVRQVRFYSGEVTIPLGQTILVSAPLGGMLREPEGGMPKIGQTVTKGQQIFSLLPLLSPEATTNFATSRADVEGQVKNANTQVEVAKLARDRAASLYKSEAGSKRAVEEAQGQLDLALRTFDAANSRLLILTQALSDSTSGRSTPIPITAPDAGILRNINALPKQNVPAGGALFEIANLSTVWIRVPVFVGDVEQIVTAAKAEVGNLGSSRPSAVLHARLVDAPPTANGLAATVDLHYSLDNHEAHLAPGQRVGVTLPIKSTGENLVVPHGAIVYDIHGNTWVYAEVKPLTYKRQRVMVHHTIDGSSALTNGPSSGAKIVTEGAIELFGAETGFSK